MTFLQFLAAIAATLIIVGLVVWRLMESVNHDWEDLQ